MRVLKVKDINAYIDALRMLLHAKDQAFYTGFPIYEEEDMAVSQSHYGMAKS